MSKRDHETGEVIRDNAADLQAKLDLLRDEVSAVYGELSAAAEIRVGAMDSDSRAQDLTRHVNATIRACAQRLLAALET